jgi:hypothetical protein
MQKWIYLLIGCIGLAKPIDAQLQLGPIGTWRAHFSNESIQQVVKGDQIYVAAANQIIQIDANRQTTYLNTTTGLHATGIHKIAWHPIENQLVITKLNDFQIVNGGQTTASLYHTQKKFKDVDLSGYNGMSQSEIRHEIRREFLELMAGASAL